MNTGQRLRAALYLVLGCALAVAIWIVVPARLAGRALVELCAFCLVGARLYVEMRFKRLTVGQVLKLSDRPQTNGMLLKTISDSSGSRQLRILEYRDGKCGFEEWHLEREGREFFWTRVSRRRASIAPSAAEAELEARASVDWLTAATDASRRPET